MTPPMTPMRVARVSALPFRQLDTFSRVSFAIFFGLRTKIEKTIKTVFRSFFCCKEVFLQFFFFFFLLSKFFFQPLRSIFKFHLKIRKKIFGDEKCFFSIRDACPNFFYSFLTHLRSITCCFNWNTRCFLV